jgi:hypothetical protein
MDKTTLYKIFSKAFDDASWLEVLKSVFGAKLGLLAQPKPILLKSNDKANAAYELGSFTTTDDRIIGLYKIEVKPEVWLERNKVGLRELLRNVYQYDVDGAIIVFVQQEKWRLSFVSEIKVLNDEGEIVEQATEPKRYTYLLGEGEKVRTPSDRLSKLAGKSHALQDILNAFSVEALNEEFYKIIQAYFYELVGGKIGKGKKVTDYGKGILQLPSVPKENRQVYQEFAVRLIGRTVFCWFLKMKKSDAEAPLLPESLLSSKAVKQYSGYYHTILERLFFQTLNTPVEQRVENLPEGADQIPFLNGGLFEPGNQDYYKPSAITGLNQNLNTLNIADQWFVHFFEELEKYNFTIDENSVTDVEVSVDPEMLGRIFENLLAEIDPDSGETARKATGSFYTPREIVDYIATESLVQYIHNKTNLPQDQLRPIFKMMDKQDFDFSKTQTEAILDALDQVKILDPACGSGAFPMGVLQKIVQALQKLDPDAEWWKKRQVARVSNAIVRKQLKEKLESSGVEYARKIGVIQNSLYGVDIQPVAAEISKLRCFLSLVVDENIDENKPNRGIEPLPNLEFKFVTADTLIKLPDDNAQRGLFDNWEEMQELEELRNDYIQSYGKQKQRIKEQFLKVQQKMFKDQLSLFSDKASRAYQLSTWNPFGHEKSDWFDPKWMFGVEKFDVVIGNPPYVEFKNLHPSIKKKLTEYKTTRGKYDLYIAFMERPIDFLNENGILCYINPTRFMHRDYGQELRKFIKQEYTIKQIIDFGDAQIFNTATTYTGIFLFHKMSSSHYEFEYGKDLLYWTYQLVSDEKLIPEPWYFQSDSANYLLNLIKENSLHFENLVEGIFQGVATGKDEVFIVKEDEVSQYKLEAKSIKKFLMGKDIGPYAMNWSKHYVIYPYEDNGKVINELKFKELYPNCYSYLVDRRPSLTGRGYFDKSNKLWYELWNQRNYERFKTEKLITLDNASKNSFAYDNSGFIGTTTTYSIVPKRGTPIFGLLGVLNSSLLNYYHKKNTIPQANGFYRYQKTFIKSFPLKGFQQNLTFYKTIGFVAQMIMFSSCLKENLNNHVPNSHIAQLFEEVIDAMVMELYFKEDFEKAGITFIKYAERDFESIEGKSEKEQIEIIHRAYQKLREKDNEIRNNLKLMDIKLADIVMPIKAAK